MIQNNAVSLPHGTTLQCRVSGDAGRPVLLFLHGFPEGAFIWDALLAHFAGERNPPRLVLRLRVAEAYLHCAKALMRARLWDSTARVERSVLPSMGRMIQDQTGSTGPLETQEQMLARYAQDL